MEIIQMTKREYKIDEWVAHDRGPCPVPEKSEVCVLWRNGIQGNHTAASLGDDWHYVVAFCVTEYPDEEEVWTYRCYVEKLSRSFFPKFVNIASNNIGSKEGLCTVTIVNGWPKRIVWEADE
jgi:hypothetical protein